VRSHPSIAVFKLNLGQYHGYRGWACWKVGRSAEAAAELRRAVALWDESQQMESDLRFERLRTLALLYGLGSDAKSGVRADEAARFADQAVAALQDAVQADWAQLDELKQTDFDALRKRADFQKLVRELEAKAVADLRRLAPPLQMQREKK
jgi:hypothetical protein